MLRGNDGTIATNTLTVGANEGITVSGSRHVVSGNDVSGYNTGIYAHSGGAGNDRITVSGNRTHDNITHGIYATTNVLVADNVVFNQAGTNDIGIYSAGGNTEIRDNVVHTNFIGIQTSDTYITENWIFNNSSAGIETYGNARITANHVYSNSIGIRNGYNFYGEITSNLIYANTNQGILFQSYQVSSEDKEVTNNTIYQLVGDAVRLEAGTNRVKLRNNIISVQAGYDISVANDSQTGFESNYNVLHQGTDANAHVGFWGGVIRDSLADWQAASSQDAGSLAADPLFVDLDGADNTLGYAAVGGGFRDGGPDDNFYRRKFSPATDRGDSWNTTPTDLEGFARVDDPGTPNAGRTDYFHSVLASNLFTATGTAQPTWRSNNNSFSYTLPFAFNFYGTSYTTVYVSTEGFLQFGDNNSSGDSANTAAKLLQFRRIAPVWDNLRTNNTGDDIFVDTTVAGQVKFRWNATNEANTTDAQFAVVLFSDGRIRFDYGTGLTSLTPTVGIGAGDGRNSKLVPLYEGIATLTNANSVEWSLLPGITDMGAYEFRGSSFDVIAPAIVGSFTTLDTDVNGAVDLLRVTFSEEMNPIDANCASQLRTAARRRQRSVWRQRRHRVWARSSVCVRRHACGLGRRCREFTRWILSVYRLQ